MLVRKAESMALAALMRAAFDHIGWEQRPLVDVAWTPAAMDCFARFDDCLSPGEHRALPSEMVARRIAKRRYGVRRLILQSGRVWLSSADCRVILCALKWVTMMPRPGVVRDELWRVGMSVVYSAERILLGGEDWPDGFVRASWGSLGIDSDEVQMAAAIDLSKRIVSSVWDV